MARTSSKTLILDVAEALFATRGIEEVSLRTVNEATGLSPAAVHYHFKNKENLLKAILLRNMRPDTERDKLCVALEQEQQALTAESYIQAMTFPLQTRFLEDGLSGEYFTSLVSQIYGHNNPDYRNYLPHEFIDMGNRARSLLIKLKCDEPLEDALMTYELLCLTWVEALAGFRSISPTTQTEDQLLQQKTRYISKVQTFLIKALG